MEVVVAMAMLRWEVMGLGIIGQLAAGSKIKSEALILGICLARSLVPERMAGLYVFVAKKQPDKIKNKRSLIKGQS